VSDEGRYLLENSREAAAERLDALSAVFDHWTFAQIESTGIGTGWRCWEVGAGGPSVPHFLARAVGGSGRVLVTDIDLTALATNLGENVEIRRHDLTMDPPPREVFDLVHARLVLTHVAAREAALNTMVSSLRPGGWLVLEDADPGLQPLSSLDPKGPEDELANRLRTGFRKLMSERGADLAFGRKLPGLLREAGLESVTAEAYLPIRLPECVGLEVTTMRVIADQLIAGGVATAGEIALHVSNATAGVLDLSQPPLVTAKGRRPAATVSAQCLTATTDEYVTTGEGTATVTFSPQDVNAATS
jgi:SAM-dependent methyltransferase